jgi:hypothetical protein
MRMVIAAVTEAKRDEDSRGTRPARLEAIMSTNIVLAGLFNALEW